MVTGALRQPVGPSDNEPVDVATRSDEGVKGYAQIIKEFVKNNKL